MEKNVESIAIKNICLKVHGKEINLTINEAKELKKLMDDLFQRETIITYPSYSYYPYPYTITWKSVDTPSWTVCCDQATSTAMYSTK